MEGIQSVSNIFSDPEKVQKILDAPSTKEIYDLFISSTCENK
jgi:mannitol/fructose-specific phosphotransferase system IIA component (Ntr-type)